MCLIVGYYCICGVEARTEQVPCSASVARPVPSRFEDTHQVRQLPMYLPRQEWDARQGNCPQESCAQNNTLTGKSGNLAKCPGCSTICYETASLPDCNNKAYSFDDLLDEGLQRGLERELSDSCGHTDKSEESEDDFEKELEKELEMELSGMDVELDINKAEFLSRHLWQTYECPVEFCPFNKNSMAQADEKLAVATDEMQREAESHVVKWTKEDDDQILDLSSHGADDELIAAVVSRQVADVHERLAFLRLLSEVLK